jgi:hypothetical protein
MWAMATCVINPTEGRKEFFLVSVGECPVFTEMCAQYHETRPKVKLTKVKSQKGTTALLVRTLPRASSLEGCAW